jgi:Ca2+-binding RTX toxin-like protein
MAALVCGAATALQATIAIVPASAATSCSLNTSTHVLSVSSTDALTVFRSGADLKFNDATGCGTVTTVDTVNVDLGGVGNFVEMELSGGPFAPGATSEGNSSSEIEFSFTNLGSGTRFSVFGSSGPDSIAVGDRRVFPELTTVTGINLNVSTDGATRDEDVVLHGTAALLGLSGEGGDDVLTGGGSGTPLSHPTVTRMVLNDGPGADTVSGGAGADIIGPEDGPDPGDTFSGGGGFDFIDYEHSPVGVIVKLDGLPNDGSGCPGAACDGDSVMPDIESVRGSHLDDLLVGGPGTQLLEAVGGTDTLSGGPGDDFMFKEQATVTFHGGSGIDLASFFGETEGIKVTLDGVANDGPPGEHDNVGKDVESVIGGTGNDHLIGNAGANSLSGDAGDDVLDGRGGNDTLRGGSGAANGSDVFIGGPGIDTVDESGQLAGLNLSIDGVANDRVVGRPQDGVDDIHTDVENVTGGFFGDRIVGDGAANRLVGGAGDDTLIGGGGNDVLQPGGGADTVTGGPGLDTASFVDAAFPISADLLAGTASGDGNDSLHGVERLVGSPFADHLVGSQGPNRLAGGAGADLLKGLAGDDVLLGGTGDDTLDGGPGSDSCDQGPGSGQVTHCEA